MRFGRKPSSEPGNRRRTVSPGGRPAAFSYHANRVESDYNLGRQQPREQDVRSQARSLRYWRQRFGILLACVVLLVCAFNVLRLTSDPKIIALTTSSNAPFMQPLSVYEQAAQRLFAKSILNANKVTVDTAKIAAQLKQQYPELADVSIALPLISHRPIIYVAPTTPALILAQQEHAYVLDTNGKALADANKVAGLANLTLPTVTDQSGLKVHLGIEVLPGSEITFIDDVVKELVADHYQVNSLTLPGATSELDVRVEGKPYFIKLNVQSGDALQQVGTYAATDKYLVGKGVTPSQYVDVRLDGRSYYK